MAMMQEYHINLYVSLLSLHQKIHVKREHKNLPLSEKNHGVLNKLDGNTIQPTKQY